MKINLELSLVVNILDKHTVSCVVTSYATVVTYGANQITDVTIISLAA